MSFLRDFRRAPAQESEVTSAGAKPLCREAEYLFSATFAGRQPKRAKLLPQGQSPYAGRRNIFSPRLSPGASPRERSYFHRGKAPMQGGGISFLRDFRRASAQESEVTSAGAKPLCREAEYLFSATFAGRQPKRAGKEIPPPPLTYPRQMCIIQAS
jgi:hypothetical protein